MVNEQQNLLLMGRLNMNDGRLSGRVKYDPAPWLGFLAHLMLTSQPQQPGQAMVDTNVKGSDWNAQLKLGVPGFLGLNYLQAVTPKLSAGGEFFWLPGSYKSGVGLALRHTGDKHVATCQMATTGIVNAQYTHKVRRGGQQREGGSRAELRPQEAQGPSGSGLDPLSVAR